jgi:hypothetical protein
LLGDDIVGKQEFGQIEAAINNGRIKRFLNKAGYFIGQLHGFFLAFAGVVDPEINQMQVFFSDQPIRAIIDKDITAGRFTGVIFNKLSQ